jgi:hypothetical protein
VSLMRCRITTNRSARVEARALLSPVVFVFSLRGFWDSFAPAELSAIVLSIVLSIAPTAAWHLRVEHVPERPGAAHW